jgi:hypothetical protein
MRGREGRGREEEGRGRRGEEEEGKTGFFFSPKHVPRVWTVPGAWPH